MTNDHGHAPEHLRQPGHLNSAAPRTQGQAVTVGIFGLFGSPNYGNEATLAAFLHHVRLRLPHVKFVCIAPAQSRVEQMYGIPRLDLHPWPIARHLWRIRPDWLRSRCIDLAERFTEPRRVRRAVGLLKGVDALAMPGTGLIDDFGQRPQDLPTHMDRWTEAARQRGIPIAFLSVGASTVTHPASRARFQRTLARAEYCSFRDNKSTENARGLGYTGSTAVFPDLAFSLPESVVGKARDRGPRPIVGVGVMGYFGWNKSDEEGQHIYRTYLAKLCSLVDALLEDGCEVRLLTGDARADDATVADVTARCGHKAGDADRLLAPTITSFQDVLAQLAMTDIVVASRFHNVLLSLMLERPTISIGYSDKNEAVMVEFGLPRYCHEIESFDVQSVLEQVRHLVRNPCEATRNLPDRLARARKTLDDQYELICDRWSKL